MTTTTTATGTADVPAQVFKKFLEALEATDVPAEATARLKKTLTVDHNFTDNALRTAVLGDELIP